MIACVITAFHMYKGDCPTAITLFHCCYPAILLEYPAVVVDHYYLCILYKNIVITPVILVMEVVKGDRWCYNSILYVYGWLPNSPHVFSTLLSNNNACLNILLLWITIIYLCIVYNNNVVNASVILVIEVVKIGSLWYNRFSYI